MDLLSARIEQPNHQQFSISNRLYNIATDVAKSMVTPVGVSLLTQCLPKQAIRAFHWLSVSYQAYSLIGHATSGVKALYQGKRGKAKQSAKACIYDIAMLAPVLSSRPEARIIAAAAQIIDQGNKTYHHLNQGDYLEAASTVGFASWSAYTVLPQVKQVTQSLCVKRRAGIDVGSGGIKVCVKDVNVVTGTMYDVADKTYKVAHQKGLIKLEDGKKRFGNAIQKESLKTFREIRHDLHTLGVQEVSAVATAAFRKAENGTTFLASVRDETGLSVQVISQRIEGVLAHKSAIAASGLDATKTVVWDIGTGSHQMISKNAKGSYSVFEDGLGAVPFENNIKESQGKSLSAVSANPISSDQLEKAHKFNSSIWGKVPVDLRKKLKEIGTQVLGIGGTFGRSVGPLVTKGTTIHQGELGSMIERGIVGKSDEVIRVSLPKDVAANYYSSDTTNCINVFSIMKALTISCVNIVNTTSARGILSSSSRHFHRLVQW